VFGCPRYWNCKSPAIPSSVLAFRSTHSIDLDPLPSMFIGIGSFLLNPRLPRATQPRRVPAHSGGSLPRLLRPASPSPSPSSLVVPRPPLPHSSDVVLFRLPPLAKRCEASDGPSKAERREMMLAHQRIAGIGRRNRSRDRREEQELGEEQRVRGDGRVP
jgi:hypothetical protein